MSVSQSALTGNSGLHVLLSLIVPVLIFAGNHLVTKIHKRGLSWRFHLLRPFRQGGKSLLSFARFGKNE